jgi:hypothetical protein
MKYESPITYHSKNIANVKVFADRQTNIKTDRPKLYAPDLSILGHNKCFNACHKKGSVSKVIYLNDYQCMTLTFILNDLVGIFFHILG